MWSPFQQNPMNTELVTLGRVIREAELHASLLRDLSNRMAAIEAWCSAQEKKRHEELMLQKLEALARAATEFVLDSDDNDSDLESIGCSGAEEETETSEKPEKQQEPGLRRSERIKQRKSV